MVMSSELVRYMERLCEQMKYLRHAAVAEDFGAIKANAQIIERLSQDLYVQAMLASETHNNSTVSKEVK